jgi:hypothetical protein
VKRNRKLIIFSLTVILLVTLTGCRVSDYQSSIYNDNSKIIKQADSYNFKNRIGSTSNDKSEMKFGTFYGVDSIWSIDAKADDIVNIEYDLKIERGNFKVVLISPDNKVTTIAEGNKSGKEELKLQDGKSRVKVVGNNAKGAIKLSAKGGENVKIRKAKD